MGDQDSAHKVEFWRKMKQSEAGGRGLTDQRTSRMIWEKHEHESPDHSVWYLGPTKITVWPEVTMKLYTWALMSRSDSLVYETGTTKAIRQTAHTHSLLCILNLESLFCLLPLC